MSKIKNILIVGLLFSSMSFAKIGVKAGPVVSDILFAVEGQIPYLSYEVRGLIHKLPYLTYQFGVFGQFTISDRVDVQPELLFSKKGLNYSSNFIYDDIKYYLDIYYLEVPILLKYNLKKSSLLIGPYTAYTFNKNLTIESYDYNYSEPPSNVKDYDLGITTGWAKDFQINNQSLIANIRASYSLINMMEYLEDFKLEYYGPKVERAKNMNIIFTIGYVFK